MMSNQSMQTLTDPVFRAKMPLFDRTIASAGLSKPQNMSGFLGKQTLPCHGAFFAYDPRGKEGAGFTSPWRNSKTSLLNDRSTMSHLSGMEGNHLIYRHDSNSSEETQSSATRHTPVKQGFMRYKKSPEISSPTAAASLPIRKQKTGGETSSSPSENSVYLAIPRPVYGHNPCCNELGCMLGQRYSVEHSSPRIPNTVYERDWMQTDAHYAEKPSVERKGQDTVLQQRVLQFEHSTDTLKRLTVDSYSPVRGRTLPAVIEPHYSSYPCTPTRPLFGSLSEHSQPLQTSPRGYPSLYPSHPTYEHMTSEVYQERSPMSKYGQLAQRQVFYYPQANVEVENRTQCKDSGSKQREDVAVIHKHTSSNPREHYIVPQSLHAEIPLPLSSTEMLPNHSFMRGLNYPCYAVPRLHLNASQIRAPLKRQHASPTFHPSHKNVSPSSQHMDHPMVSASSLQKDKPKHPALHVDHLPISSPFLPVTQTSPVRRVSKPGVSPSVIEMRGFFPPLNRLHMDPPILPPLGLNVDRVVDYSSCDSQVPCPTQPKNVPGSPAVWRPQSPNRSSNRIHTDVPKSANVQKSINSPAFETGSKHKSSVSSPETTVNKQCLKRSVSHSSSPVKIKEEDKDLYEVEWTRKRQKLETEIIREGNKNDSPPMPVIDNVFSLAPYQGYLQGGISGAGASGKACQSSEQHEVKSKPDKEKKQDQAKQEPVVCLVFKETHTNTPKEKSAAETVEPKNVKVEKLDKSDISSSTDDSISPNNSSKMEVKKEPTETASPDDGPIFLKKTIEPEEHEAKPSIADEKKTSDESKPAEMTAQTNSTSEGDTNATQHKQELTLPPKPTTPLPGSKLNFKNIPPQCLKLSTYKIIIPNGKNYFPIPPPQTPTAQPAAEFIPNQDLQMPTRKHFFELHQSFCKLVSKSVSTSSEQDLKKWLSQLKITESLSHATKVQKVSCLLGVKAREAWLNEEMKSALDTVLDRLREYSIQERCPFPHVMRTGAVFLPMLVVKELLFPMVHGSFIDQVLQEHKVELRPTTLSEEKILIQLHKRACSSRLRRLMSLKHLPNVYADAVNLLYYVCVCKQLGLDMDSDHREQDGSCEASNSGRVPVFSDTTASAASHSELHPQRCSEDEETQLHLNRNKTKRRVKSSSRRTFLDNSLSDEEERGDKDKIVAESTVNTTAKKNCSAHEPQESDNKGTDYMVSEQDPYISWMCPLDELSPFPSDAETEGSSSMWHVGQSSPSVKSKENSKNCSGVIVKLRKILSEGLKRKKTRYQAVSESETSADASISQTDDGESVIGEADVHRRTPKAKHSAEHRRRWVLRSAVQRAQRAMRFCYPELVGKRIRHLYEEVDKSEVWYRGEVLRIHEAHPNPLKTIFEVRYDSEPEWKYYLELLIDYKKGWLKIED
ncbi:hypothetical protein ACER0C_005470 [Sarotherodon galilaeus]